MRYLLLFFCIYIFGCSQADVNIHDEQDAIILKVAKSAESKQYYSYAAYLREKYQRKRPKDYVAMRALALDLEASNAWRKSIFYLNKLHRHDPNDLEVLLHLAHAYAHNLAWQNAFAYYKQVLSKVPSAQAYNGMGVVLNSAKQFSMSLLCFDKALRLDPGNSSILNNKALTLAMIGRREEAIKILDNLVLINVGNSYKSNLYLVRHQKHLWSHLFASSDISLNYTC